MGDNARPVTQRCLGIFANGSVGFAKRLETTTLTPSCKEFSHHLSTARQSLNQMQILRFSHNDMSS